MRKSGLATLAVSLVILLVAADSGLAGPGSMTVVGAALALLQPLNAPYLLIAAAGIQDAPGQAGQWWYVSVVVLGTITIASEVVRRLASKQRAIGARVLVVLAAAVALVVYAGIVSAIFDHTGRYPQSEDRPYVMVAGLMAFMMIAGVAAASSMIRDGWHGHLGLTVAMLVTNSLVFTIGQFFIDPYFMASAEGQEAISEAAQLTEASALGFARIHGPFLTPNGFAMAYSLMLLLYAVRAQERRIKGLDALAFIALGLAFSVLALSKSMISYVGLVGALMVAQIAMSWNLSRRVGSALLGLLAITSLILLLFMFGRLDAIVTAFRLDNELGTSESYRSQAWAVVVEKLDAFGWIFGTGVSHWPVLFERNLTFKLSDPHTVLLSLPGTFGVLGVTFYLVLVVLLVRIAVINAGARRLLALALLILLLVKDVASIPYLFGNTPMTMLIWILLALVTARNCEVAATSAPSPAGERGRHRSLGVLAIPAARPATGGVG